MIFSVVGLCRSTAALLVAAGRVVTILDTDSDSTAALIKQQQQCDPESDNDVCEQEENIGEKSEKSEIPEKSEKSEKSEQSEQSAKKSSKKSEKKKKKEQKQNDQEDPNNRVTTKIAMCNVHQGVSEPFLVAVSAGKSAFLISVNAEKEFEPKVIAFTFVLFFFN